MALTATAIILHKKGKLKKQKVAIPQAQQPLQKIQNTNVGNVLKTETPKIFSDFQI